MSELVIDSTPTPSDGRLLEVTDLRMHFHTATGLVKAVDGVDFTLDRGKTLAIVGESGSGKTVTVTSMMGLVPMPPGRIEAGKAIYKGRHDLLRLSPEEMRGIRGREIAMIFQDPLTALNPVHRVGNQIIEMIRAHEDVTKEAAKKRAIDLLALVGIPQPNERVDGYPHEFSGGMRQRAMIAMALSLNPSVLIADEPTTALDVTVQAQILDLLLNLQKEFGMGLIMITHDLGVVAQIADEILVMYAGRMVERGTPEEVFYKPLHPYTWGLLGSIPKLSEEQEEALVQIPGMPPSLQRVPPGCPFHPRCTFRFDPCDKERPELEMRADHPDSCWLSNPEKEAGREKILGRVGTPTVAVPEAVPVEKSIRRRT